MWLRQQHPGFFWVLVGAAICVHIIPGALQVWGEDALFAAPSQHYVYAVVSREGWGVAGLMVGVGMLIGLTLTSFEFVRITIAAGALLALLRAVFMLEALAKGEGGAIGVPLLVFVGIVHMAMLHEPPRNPAAVNAAR